MQLKQTLALRSVPSYVFGIAKLRPLLCLFIAGLAVRLAAMNFLVLIPEEAYYWMYAKNPALSYYDHPPMVAWVIGLGTWLFGDTEFGVRIVGNLMMCGASVFLYLFARLWFGAAAALVSAMSIHVLPVFAAVGLIATMDAPLIFFWTLCLFGAGLALQHGRSVGWLIAGVGCGGAMLCKYTGVFLGLGCLLAVVSHTAWRRHLFTVYPYLAAITSLALFSPVIIWNARHDWASFRFQFLDRFEGQGFDLTHATNFIGQEFAVATPVILLIIAWIVYRSVRRPHRLRCPRTLMAFSFGLPLLAVMFYKSFRYPIHINWTMPAYLSLLPLACHIMTALSRLHAQRLLGRVHTALLRRPTALGWTVIICMVFNIAGLGFLVVLQPHLNVVPSFGPWQELASIVEQHEDAFEQEIKSPLLVLAGGKYRLASVLGFYRMPLEDDMNAADQTSNQIFLGQTGLGFAYWKSPDEWIGRDFIYVEDNGNLRKELRGFFKSIEIVDDPRLVALGYQLAICHNYQGPRKKSSARR